MYINISGTWRKATSGFVNVNGTWKKITSAFVNISGTWRKLIFGGGSQPANNLTISQSTNSTTFFTTLTGTNYHWSPAPSSMYYKFQWYNGTDWVDISGASGTITNPTSGSTNTKTWTIQNSDNQYLPNFANQYRFYVYVYYNGDLYAESSSSTTVNGPTNITLNPAIVNASSPYSAIDLSWSTSTYAQSYNVYYRISASNGGVAGSWVQFTTTTSTSSTVTGLQENTYYDFRVQPITGTSLYPAYSGNYSDFVTKRTDAQPSFSIQSSTKSAPGSPGPYGSTRDIYAIWQELYFEVDGGIVTPTRYEYKIENSYDGITWVNATTGLSFVEISYSGFYTTNRYVTQSIWAYRPYIRFSVRALMPDGSYIYALNNQFESVGTAPSGLSIAESSKTATSFTFTWSLTSSGSNTLNNIQYKIGSGGTWTDGGTTSPITISGLSGSTAYTVYVRAKNNDILYSSEQSLSFTTPQASVAPNGGSASISGTGTQGQTLTLSKTDASGTPSPTVSWVWQRNDGGTGGSTYRDVQSGGTTYSLTSADANYSIRVVVTWSNGVSPNQVVTTNSIGPITPLYWIVSYNANGGSNAPASTYIIRGLAGNVTSSTPTRSGYTFQGWNTSSDGGGTNYSSGALITPTSDITLYAKWQVVFTTPSAPAPSLFFERITSNSTLRWYADYPSTSGSVQSITGMQYEIRTTAGGGTLLASGTRGYSSSYIYYGGGTYWQFKMGTELGDISYSSAARYGRARVVMLGTNGTTYYGSWSGWI